MIALAVIAAAAVALAQDLRADATQLSDRAFALLNSINTGHTEGGPSPLLGPAANFAGDAQALSKAVNAGDRNAAASAVTALQSDRLAVDATLATNPGALDSAKWNQLKQQLDLIAKAYPSAGVGRSAAAAPAHGAEPEQAPPMVKIESAQLEAGDLVHFKGYFKGRDLRSAGIYRGSRLLRALDLKRVPGAQRVNFDIQLAGLEPGTTIRVYDRSGRSAETEIIAAPPPTVGLVEAAPEAAVPPPRTDKTIEVGAEPSVSPNIVLGGSTETSAGERMGAGAEEPADSSASNTEEIPTNNPPSPSKRHLRSHKYDHFRDLQIRLTNVQLVDPLLHEYQVEGQVAGTGIERAGIYVDGRRAADIPVSGGEGFTTNSFTQTFEMNGREATIRVYGPHDGFVENSLQLGASPMPAATYNANPNQLAVQVTSLQPLGVGAYLATGRISGRNLASAGLFQNGLMVQEIAVAGGLLSTFVPDTLRQVNFSVQFNPAAGVATIRVFDTAGQSVEQPLMAGMIGSPYGVSPYGVNPYGRGVNPYGNANPGYSGYNMNSGARPPSYGGGAYPSPPPPKSPWWQQFMR